MYLEEDGIVCFVVCPCVCILYFVLYCQSNVMDVVCEFIMENDIGKLEDARKSSCCYFTAANGDLNKQTNKQTNLIC